MLKKFLFLMVVAGMFASCGGNTKGTDDSQNAENERLTKVRKQIQYFRDSMETAGVDHLSFYSVRYVSHVEKQEGDSGMADVIPVGDFESVAGNFVDQEVKVSGIVDHVCKHGGKKILLVSDDGDTHVFSDDRFDEAMVGTEVIITGKVEEERIDEAYLLKMEEDAINKHAGENDAAEEVEEQHNENNEAAEDTDGEEHE